jgi:hypothetical protein
MKGLLFLSRLAFICNVLFGVCVLIQRVPNFIINTAIVSTIGVLGWFLAPFLNLAVNIVYVFLFIRKKQDLLPGWLMLTNLLFLLAQIFVHFILPA